MRRRLADQPTLGIDVTNGLERYLSCACLLDQVADAGWRLRCARTAEENFFEPRSPPLQPLG
jgi:hypothetical protein